MKTQLLPDHEIRENVGNSMAGAPFVAAILGLVPIFLTGLILKLCGILMLKGAGTGALIALGCAWAALSWASYRLLIYIEYTAANKFHAELDDKHLVVTGRSGREIELLIDQIDAVNFSGKYSEFTKAILVFRRDREEFHKLLSSMLTITDRKGKKHKFERFFLSVDPESFAALIDLLIQKNPDIEVT